MSSLTREKPRVFVYDEHDSWPLIEGQVANPAEGFYMVTMPNNGKKYSIKRLNFNFDSGSVPSPGTKPHLHPYLHIKVINVDIVRDSKDLRTKLETWVHSLYGAEYLVILVHPTLVQHREHTPKEAKGGVVEALFSKKNPVDAARQRIQDMDSKLREKFRTFCWGTREAAEVPTEIRKLVFATFDARLQNCFRNANDLKKDWDNNPKLCPYIAIIDEIGMILLQFGMRDEAACTYGTLTRELEDMHFPNPVFGLSFGDKVIDPMYVPDASKVAQLFLLDQTRREDITSSLRSASGQLSEVEVRVFIFVSQCTCWMPPSKKTPKKLKEKFEQWLQGLVELMERRNIPAPNIEATKYTIQISFSQMVTSWERKKHARSDSSQIDLDLSGTVTGETSPIQCTSPKTQEAPTFQIHEPDAISEAGVPGLNNMHHLAAGGLGGTWGSPAPSSGQSLVGDTAAFFDSTNRYEYTSMRHAIECTHIEVLLEARVSFLNLGRYFNLKIPRNVTPDDVGEEIFTDPSELSFTVQDEGAPFNMEGLKSQKEFEEHYIALTLHNMRGCKGHLMRGLEWDVAPALVSRGYLSVAYDLIRSQAEYYAALKWVDLSIRARRLALVCLAAMKDEYSTAWISTALSVISESEKKICKEEKIVLWNSLKTRLAHIPKGHEFPLLSLARIESIKVVEQARLVKLKIQFKINAPSEGVIDDLSMKLMEIPAVDEASRKYASFEASLSGLSFTGNEESLEATLVGEPLQPGDYKITLMTISVEGMVLRQSLSEEECILIDQTLMTGTEEESKLTKITDKITVHVDKLEPLVKLSIERGVHPVEHMFEGSCEAAVLTMKINGELPELKEWEGLSTSESPKGLPSKTFSGDELAMTHDSCVTAPQVVSLPDVTPPDGCVGYLTFDTQDEHNAVIDYFDTTGCDDKSIPLMITSRDGHSMSFVPPEAAVLSSDSVHTVPIDGLRSTFAVVPKDTATNTAGGEWKIRIPVNPVLCGRKLGVSFLHTLPQMVVESPVLASTCVLPVPFTMPFKVCMHARPDETRVFANAMFENQLPFKVRLLSIEPVMPDSEPYGSVGDNRYEVVRNKTCAGIVLGPKEGYAKALSLQCGKNEVASKMCEVAMRVKYQSAEESDETKSVNTFETFPVRWLPPVPPRATVYVTMADFAEPLLLTKTVAFNITITHNGRPEDSPLHLWSVVVFPLDDWFVVGPCRKLITLTTESPTVSFPVHMTPITTGNLGTLSVRLTSRTQHGMSSLPDQEIPIRLVQSQARVMVVNG